MSKWRTIQTQLIDKAVSSKLIDIAETDISHGRIQGTVYCKKNSSPKKGVLLVHAIGSNRYMLGTLAIRLAQYGFFCLSIDLPSHFLNTNKFTLGEISETITDGVLLLKKEFGVQRIAVIGFSIGAVGAFFSNAGYNVQIENEVYGLWEQIVGLIEEEEKRSNKEGFDINRFNSISRQIEGLYTRLKEVIFLSLKKGIQESSNVSCYIMLSLPLNCKNGLPPGLRTLRKLKAKWLSKRVIEGFSYIATVRRYINEGLPLKYMPQKAGPDEVSSFFFRTGEIFEFVDYISSMKEPIDFLNLVESIVKFRHKDGKINFFEFYLERYFKRVPKLFVYGRRDWILRAFFSSDRMRLENFYKSCGNAEVKPGDFTHIIDKNPRKYLAFIQVTNTEVTKLIIKFLDKNM